MAHATQPRLEATIDGVAGNNVPLSSYQVNGPGFSMAVTGFVSSTSDNDNDTVANAIAQAVNTSTEMPINFNAAVTTGTRALTLTAQAVGYS